MIREVVLRPRTVHLLTGATQIEPGTSYYPQNNTPSVTLAEAWADELNRSFYYPYDAQKGIVGLEAPPSLVLFRKITLSTSWDYSQAGPNNWYFPPDNAHGPRLRHVLIGRDGSSQHTSPWYEVGDIPGEPGNVNTNTQGLDFFDLYEQTWELTSHPDGGPFTFDDVLNLKVGVECGMADGPSGQPWDPSQGGFFKLRVVRYAVALEVEDLGGFVDNIRHSTAMSLRLFRRPRAVIRPRVRFDQVVGDIGSRVYFSHARGPVAGDFGGGWGVRRLERRAGLILKRSLFPEQFEVQDEALDLRGFACLIWAAYRIGEAWSPELQGLTLLEKGGGYVHGRALDAWSPRPGDGRLMRVLEDYPNLSSEGLASQGGGDVSVCHRNYDLTQSGWTATGESGDFTISQDTTVAMVEERGYLSAAKLAFGAGGGTGGRYRSLGTLPYNAGDHLHLEVIVRNTSVPTPVSQFLEWRLLRSGGGLAQPEYWNEATRAWGTSAVDNPIPSEDPVGRVRVDRVPLDAAGASSDPTYQIDVGRFSSSIASCTFHAALVDAQHSSDQVAGARTPQVVLDSDITRVADVHSLANTASAELWDYERGTAVVEVAPGWDGAHLPVDAVKPLLHCQHAAATHDAIQYVAKATDSLIRFERAVSGQATFQLDVVIPNTGSTWDVKRGHILRAWARWLGADGWRNYAPYSVEVGFAVFDANGDLVETASALGALAYTGNVAARDALYPGNDPTPRYLDGFVRFFEVRRNPLHALECLWKV